MLHTGPTWGAQSLWWLVWRWSCWVISEHWFPFPHPYSLIGGWSRMLVNYPITKGGTVALWGARKSYAPEEFLGTESTRLPPGWRCGLTNAKIVSRTRKFQCLEIFPHVESIHAQVVWVNPSWMVKFFRPGKILALVEKVMGTSEKCCIGFLLWMDISL